MLQLDDLEAGAGRLRELEVDSLQLLVRLLDGDGLEALDLLLLRLGARGHRGLGAEAIDEFLEVRDLALLVLEKRGLLRFPGLLFLEEIIVVAVVVVERAGAQLEHAGAEGVEERAIVRDDHEAAGIAGEVFLEPQQRLEIEMVRRLVEQQERRLGDEQAREVRAHHPTAGESLRELVSVAFLEAEAGEDFLGARLERVVDVEVVLGRLEFFSARRYMKDRFLARGRAFLGQVAKGKAALHGDLAVVGRLLIEDDGEERGFPRAVGAHQSDAVAAVDLERDVFKKHPSGEGLRDIGEEKHVGVRTGSLPAGLSMQGLTSGRRNVAESSRRRACRARG